MNQFLFVSLSLLCFFLNQCFSLATIDDEKCREGPYLHFDIDCGQLRGLDNRFLSLASQLSFALALNLSYVSPFKRCWLNGMSNEFDKGDVGTQLIEFLGWRRNAAGVSCTAEALAQFKTQQETFSHRKNDFLNLKFVAGSFFLFCFICDEFFNFQLFTRFITIDRNIGIDCEPNQLLFTPQNYKLSLIENNCFSDAIASATTMRNPNNTIFIAQGLILCV